MMKYNNKFHKLFYVILIDYLGPFRPLNYKELLSNRLVCRRVEPLLGIFLTCACRVRLLSNLGKSFCTYQGINRMVGLDQLGRKRLVS